MTIHFPREQSLRISGVVPQPIHTPLCDAQGQLCSYFGCVSR
jgi:hypothetical protein